MIKRIKNLITFLQQGNKKNDDGSSTNGYYDLIKETLIQTDYFDNTSSTMVRKFLNEKCKRFTWDNKRSFLYCFDWKTGSAEHVDPMQLAVYRLAWARQVDVPLDRVGAAFLVVGTGEVLRPDTDALVSALLRD